MKLQRIKNIVTTSTQQFSHQRKCLRCDEWMLPVDNSELNKNTKFCDKCFSKKLRDDEKIRYRKKVGLRFCKCCNIVVEKNKQYCTACNKDIKQKRKKHYRELQKLNCPKKVETSSEREIIIVGIKAGNSHKQILENIKSKTGIIRSSSFVYNTIRRLGGIEKINGISFSERQKQKRENSVKEWGYTIEKFGITKKMVLLCNTCKNTILYKTVLNRKGKCYYCSLTQKTVEREIISEEKKKQQKETNKNIKQTRLLKIAGIKEKLEQFAFDKTNWKSFDNWKQTPIYKEYSYYTKLDTEFQDTELVYKLKEIGFFHFKGACAQPPYPPKKGNKLCRGCKKEKSIKKFSRKTNYCKQCSQTLRKKYLPEEVAKIKQKYKNDMVFRLRRVLSSHICFALKNKKYFKSKKTEQIVGLSATRFASWIEKHFEDWMTWDNYGNKPKKWVIQHIVPRSWAQTEEEIYVLNYHKNLIPMCATKNNALRDRVIQEQLNDWHKANKVVQQVIERNKSKIVNLHVVQK